MILANLGLFRGFLTPFGALGTQREIFRKIFYSAQLDMKIQLVAKFEKNLMDGYPALVRTDERTNGTDNFSPFPTKVGGLIKDIQGYVGHCRHHDNKNRFIFNFHCTFYS